MEAIVGESFRAPVRPGWRQLGAAAGLGALAATGQAPLGWWWMALPALGALLALVAMTPRVGGAAWLGWFGGAGHFGAALFWIVEPFLVDPLRHVWFAPFAMLGMSFGLALFWAAGAGVGRWLGGERPMLTAAALAVALAAAELARGHVFAGFPWATPGHVWIDTPVGQLASLVGASGLTLITFAIAALPLVAGGGLLARAAGVAAAVALLALGWVWGQGRLDAPLPVAERDAVLRLVQPNAPQHLKWHPDWVGVFLERQLEATAAPAERDPDLVVWSETAIPWLLEDAGPVLDWVAAAAGGIPVAMGVQRQEAGRFFNSLALLEDGEPTQLYDKHHLVPFGEYVPFAEAIFGVGYAGIASRQLAGFSPGPGPALMDLGELGRVLPLICYEAVFPRHLRATERPDWVLQVTNDAWFGRLVGPFQHLAQARLRAIETGLPVVRAANTGVSAVIDARGAVTAELGLNRPGFLDAALPAALPATPFARWGEAPLAVFLALALAAFAFRRWRQSK